MGFVLTVAAALLALAGLGQLIAARTTIQPTDAPRRLVTGGIYRLTRNPSYLSLLTLHAGLALVLAAPVTLMMVLPPFLALDRVVVPFEEAALHRVFGDAFTSYRRRVRRWL